MSTRVTTSVLGRIVELAIEILSALAFAAVQENARPVVAQQALTDVRVRRGDVWGG